MAGLNLSGLLGAAANVTTLVKKEKSVKSFIKNVNKFGMQVANNFEVNFSGLQEATFFIQDIDIPAVKQNIETIHYDGRAVDVPVNYDFEHDFSMTVWNDAQGYIYSALANFIMSSCTHQLAPAGYTMTIKAYTGDEKHYKGALVTMSGVRFVSLSGLSWGQSKNEIQTFTVNGKLTDFNYTPGALEKPAGVLGTIESLL